MSTPIAAWKAQFGGSASFGSGNIALAAPAIDVKSLRAKIGQLTPTVFRRSAHQGGIAERKAMIDL
jgi:putative transposase